VTTWHRWARRIAVPVTTVPVLLFVWIATAYGDDGSKLSQTPGALSWTNPKDSRGIGVWNYEMSLDRGGITSPGKVIWSSYVDLYWTIYRSIVVVAIWLIDWVLSFSWLTALATPALALSRSLTSVVERFGLPPTLLTIAAAISVLWMAKGKWALGILELFTSLLVASLAIGVLANPVERVAGDHGLIVQSRDLGLQVANRLAHDGHTSGDATQLRKDNSALLVDTFVRMPAEVLNFGTVLDGGKCEKAYTKAVKGGPYGNQSTIRDAVGNCDSSLGAVAADPGPGQAVSSLVITPSALFILLFAIILAGAVFLAALYALFHSLKAIITLVTGLLPGVARGALWQTIADLTMSLVTLVFSIVFLTGYLLLIQGVFASTKPGSGVMATFFFVDVLLLAGIIVFWRARRSLRRAADGIAKALASRPGPPPEPHRAALPGRGRGVAKTAVETAGVVVAIRTLRPKRRASRSTDAKPAVPAQKALPSGPQQPGPLGPRPHGPGPLPPRTRPPDPPPGPHTPGPPGSGPPGSGPPGSGPPGSGPQPSGPQPSGPQPSGPPAGRGPSPRRAAVAGRLAAARKDRAESRSEPSE
jgi:hypothetical protein